MPSCTKRRQSCVQCHYSQHCLQMRTRRFWLGRIEDAWRRRSVLWLSGVRRAGKTVLAQSLPHTEVLDCERPRVRRLLEDPEGFLAGVADRRVVLDEIHRLPDPSEVLKVAADHFPRVRILATGSSTLGASAKFRDTLTGRKTDLWLTPMNAADLADFGSGTVRRRLRHGGRPPFFLDDDPPENDFQEWMDSYWAKDIQELFRIERRASFQRFTELLLAQSGGMFEASSFAAPCGVSRPTIANYLAILEATFVVHVLRPFSTHRQSEIVAAPRVYGFDTGFVCYHRGVSELRNDDLGPLWEHYVLNEIHGQLQSRAIRYWRDKRGHEVDFVLARRGRPPIAIECKWSARAADLAGLRAFLDRYPGASAFLVAQDVDRSSRRRVGDHEVAVVGLTALIEQLLALPPRTLEPTPAR